MAEQQEVVALWPLLVVDLVAKVVAFVPCPDFRRSGESEYENDEKRRKHHKRLHLKSGGTSKRKGHCHTSRYDHLHTCAQFSLAHLEARSRLRGASSG